MKVLTGKNIAKAINQCCPRHIAVAFIGTDWSKFICDPSSLESVIVSPTLGTNPSAVVDLAEVIGWDKLHFLDDLHAKIYFGQHTAVVGSSNLTRNGLCGERLIELCVEIQDGSVLKKLDGMLRELRLQAAKQYPNTKAKKVKIGELVDLWNAAIANKIIHRKPVGRSFSNFKLLTNDQFYVMWYQLGDVKYSDDVKMVESLIKDDAHFAATDSVRENKWVLMWRITDKFTPDGKVYWFYIHKVFDNGIVDDGYEYTKCAIQWKDKKVPPPPFKLTKDVITAFKKAVVKKEIAKHLIQANQVFNLKHSFQGLPMLLHAMKNG